MRGRRRYRAQRRPRIPPAASIAPVAQHRGGNAQLACDLAQRPTAAHQQGYRFLLELIRKMTPSLAHLTPFPLPPDLTTRVPQFRAAASGGGVVCAGFVNLLVPPFSLSPAGSASPSGRGSAGSPLLWPGAGAPSSG